MAEMVRVPACEPTIKLPEGSSPITPAAQGKRNKGKSAGTLPLWKNAPDVHYEEPAALSLRRRSVGDVILADVIALPITVTDGGTTADNPHRFHLILLVEEGDHRWADGKVTQKPGDIMLLDTAEPSEVSAAMNDRVLRWSCPETLIAPFPPVSDGVAVHHLQARDGLMRNLAQHICDFACEADHLDSDAQQGLLVHLCGLLRLAIETEQTPQPGRRLDYRSFQRQRILTYIDLHLDDCRLTAKRAAGDLGMSPRWLHALLEDAGDGFCGLVAKRRLEMSLNLLRDPACSHMSIAEIAFLCGFNDLSTFYRRFGELYKTTPGEVRRRRLQTKADIQRPICSSNTGIAKRRARDTPYHPSTHRSGFPQTNN